MGSSFTGFLPGDFDAFSQEKWSSNMWNRQRLEVKQRAMVLGREAAAFLADLGLPLSLGASDEHPSLWNKKRVDCQWLFFWRNEEERKVLEAIVDRDRRLAATLFDPTPFSRHAFLSVKLDVLGLELAFRVHRNAWVDFKSLRCKLATTAGAAELLRLVRELPDAFALGEGEGALPAAQATPDALRRAIAEEDPAEWFSVAVRMGRDQAIELGTTIGASVEEAFRWLVPLYRFVAWSRENDFVSIDQALAQEAAERQVAHERLTSEERERQEKLAHERDLARQRARDRGPAGATPWLPPRPPRAGSTPPAEPAVAPRPAAREVARREDRPEKATVGQGRPAAPAERRPVASSATAGPTSKPVETPPAAVDKGVRVRIGKGPLAGRVGTVAEIDKGVARVLLGLMAARVDVEDLVPVGVDRRRSGG